MKLVPQRPTVQKQNPNRSIQERKRIPIQVNRMGLITPRGPRTIASTKTTTTIQPRINVKKTKPKMTMVHQRPPAPRKGLLTRVVEGIFRSGNRSANIGHKVGEKVRVIKK